MIGGICSRCRCNSGFEHDDTGELVSQCCGWPMIDFDSQPDDFDVQLQAEDSYLDTNDVRGEDTFSQGSET